MNSKNVTKIYTSVAWFVILAVALVSRFWDLDNKPLHFDEAINGWFVMTMDTAGFYRYDPNNYHGPLYFYLLYFFEALWGVSIHTLRSVPASFSFFAVMLFSWSVLKQKVSLWSIFFFLLISPAFIFFGRSGIHEMVFVFFQILFALGILRWIEQRDSKALALLFWGLWGMILLKETFLITGFAAVVGLASLGWNNIKSYLKPSQLKAAWSPALSVLVAALLLSFVLLYSGFFKNFQGLADFFKALLPWLKTGVHGNGHEKPLWYWLEVLLHSEPLVLVGVVVAVVGVFSKNVYLRWASVFSLVQLLVYSLIPYKTVWCIVSLVWGFYFVLGFALQEMWTKKALLKGSLLAVISLSVSWGFYSVYQGVYKSPIDMSHEYVYVNSTYELKLIERTLRQKMEQQPELKKLPLQVGIKEQWPWPWLLQGAQAVNYSLCQKKLLPDPWVVFCELEDQILADPIYKGTYWKMRVALRQAKGESIIYFRKDIFQSDDFPGLLNEVP